jgi:hypothetical protein
VIVAASWAWANFNPIWVVLGEAVTPNHTGELRLELAQLELTAPISRLVPTMSKAALTGCFTLVETIISCGCVFY